MLDWQSPSCEVKCNQVAGACLIQCIHNAAMRFSISWARFLETQALPFSRIQWVLTDFFTGESYGFFGEFFTTEMQRNFKFANQK